MKYLISIYCWIVGFIFLIFVLVFALLASTFFDEQKYNPWLQKLLKIFLKILGIKLDVEGLENIQPGRTYLFMANHASLFDVPVLGAAVPGVVRGIEAGEQHTWPLYGKVMKKLGNISIDRKRIFDSVRSMEIAKEVMNSGKSLIILPEGHRTMDGNLREFYTLPFQLAKNVGCDLIPIGMSGLYSLKSKNSWLIKPGRIKVKFGEAIDKDILSAADPKELKKIVRDRINSLVEYP